MNQTVSSPALGAVAAGIRYQVRFFWRQALPMLYGTHIAKVVVEHRGIDAVDDVVVYYTPPGVNDDGAGVTVDFHQIKFHVAQSGAVHHDALVDAAWTGTTRSMLARFADAWKNIRGEHPNGRLKLVTNWPWDPQSELAPLVRDGGRLGAKFLAAGTSSSVGKIRARWQEACGLDDHSFNAFITSLRFTTSAVSQEESEEWLRDRCQLAGLVPIPHGIDWSPYDDIGKRLIETGRTEQTPASLRALVESQGLVAPGDPPFRSTFAVRSFTRFAHRPETDGACAIDLTDLFDGRLARQENSWGATIPARLAAAIPLVERLPEPVHVALDTHLSIAWHTGRLLDAKSGKRVVLRQRVAGKGVEIWDASAPVRPDGAPAWTVSVADIGDAGSEVALVISVTHSALTDASHFVAKSLPKVGAIISAELPTAGQQAVRDGGHARWLGDELLRALEPVLAARRPAHLHIFPACPASLAFLLGQQSRAIGPHTIYEYDFGHQGRGYRPGMTSGTE
jgi:hypothetical protein